MSENNNAFVIYSPNESALGDGFWSNENGWVDLAQATRFTKEETEDLNLPVSTGGDARWVPYDEAAVSYGDIDDEILLDAQDWRRSVKAGSRVFWKDPDNDISTGIYTVEYINTETSLIESDDSLLMLKNGHGSECEVFASEIQQVSLANAEQISQAEHNPLQKERLYKTARLRPDIDKQWTPTGFEPGEIVAVKYWKDELDKTTGYHRPIYYITKTPDFEKHLAEGSFSTVYNAALQDFAL